jgi:hypothetical protein
VLRGHGGLWSAAWPAHAALGFVVLLWPILYALVYLA